MISTSAYPTSLLPSVFQFDILNIPFATAALSLSFAPDGDLDLMMNTTATTECQTLDVKSSATNWASAKKRFADLFAAKCFGNYPDFGAC